MAVSKRIGRVLKNHEKLGFFMELSERKLKILNAVISEYVQSAEPVSSKTIAEKSGLGLSSATIRNEFAELTEMGLIEQPHTSAGRVPSHLGYRVFVDNMVENYRLSINEQQKINSMLTSRITEAEALIAEMGKSISGITQMTTVAIPPRHIANIVKRFEFVQSDKYSFLLVIITGGGSIKNKIFRSTVPISHEVLDTIAEILNRRFTNMDVEQISLPLIMSVQNELRGYDFMLSPILTFIYDALGMVHNDAVYIEGQTNILDYPEFQTPDKLRDMFDVLQNNSGLKRLLEQSCDLDDKGVRVVIGNENPQEKLQDTSMVISNYKVAGRNAGAIAVIGPTRMDYGKVAAQLEYITDALSRILSELYPQIDKDLGDTKEK